MRLWDVYLDLNTKHSVLFGINEIHVHKRTIIWRKENIEWEKLSITSQQFLVPGFNNVRIVFPMMN